MIAAHPASTALRASIASVASVTTTMLANFDAAEAANAISAEAVSEARELTRVLARAQRHLEAKLGAGGEQSVRRVGAATHAGGTEQVHARHGAAKVPCQGCV